MFFGKQTIGYRGKYDIYIQYISIHTFYSRINSLYIIITLIVWNIIFYIIYAWLQHTNMYKETRVVHLFGLDSSQPLTDGPTCPVRTLNLGVTMPTWNAWWVESMKAAVLVLSGQLVIHIMAGISYSFDTCRYIKVIHRFRVGKFFCVDMYICLVVNQIYIEVLCRIQDVKCWWFDYPNDPTLKAVQRYEWYVCVPQN